MKEKCKKCGETLNAKETTWAPSDAGAGKGG